jgi:hypothetical protein
VVLRLGDNADLVDCADFYRIWRGHQVAQPVRLRAHHTSLTESIEPHGTERRHTLSLHAPTIQGQPRVEATRLPRQRATAKTFTTFLQAACRYFKPLSFDTMCHWNCSRSSCLRRKDSRYDNALIVLSTINLIQTKLSSMSYKPKYPQSHTNKSTISHQLFILAIPFSHQPGLLGGCLSFACFCAIAKDQLAVVASSLPRREVMTILQLHPLD